MLPMHETARRLLLELDVPAPERTKKALRQRLATEYSPKHVGSALNYLKRAGLIAKEPHPASRGRIDNGHAYTLTPVGQARRDAILALDVKHEIAEMRADEC